MDHVGINAASPQPTGQPKTIPSGLIRDRNPRDLLPRLDGLVTPTIQKLQQLLWIRRNLLQRFAIDARDHAGDEPARESHFYDDYERAILHKGGAADFAVVVGFLHMKLPQSPLTEATTLTLSRPLTHSIFLQHPPPLPSDPHLLAA